MRLRRQTKPVQSNSLTVIERVSWVGFSPGSGCRSQQVDFLGVSRLDSSLGGGFQGLAGVGVDADGIVVAVAAVVAGGTVDAVVVGVTCRV